jgi:hypothetical protein
MAATLVPSSDGHARTIGRQGYRSGRSPDWLKMKNADAPVVKREAEEERGKQKCR